MINLSFLPTSTHLPLKSGYGIGLSGKTFQEGFSIEKRLTVVTCQDEEECVV